MLYAYRLSYCLALKLTDYYNFIVGDVIMLVFSWQCTALEFNSIL